jgi:hypothetical protein
MRTAYRALGMWAMIWLLTRVCVAFDQPDPACPICKGLGILPNLPYKPHIWQAGVPLTPGVPPPWKYCDRCQKHNDPKNIVEMIKLANNRTLQTNKENVQQSGVELELLTTPFVSIHTNLPPDNRLRVAEAFEKVSTVLLETSKSMWLAGSRPDQDHCYIFKDIDSYQNYITKMFGEKVAPYQNKTGFNTQHLDIARDCPDSQYAYQMSLLMIMGATNQRAPFWLLEGLSSYCESKAFGTENYGHGRLEGYRGKRSQHVKDFANNGKLAAWEHLFTLKMSSTSQTESLQCMSAVRCLIELDPTRLDYLMQNIKNGDDSTTAIEKAYGRKLAELEAYWQWWVLRQN